MNVKSQATQTFTFLSAAIIIGIILLFGGYAVTQLISNVQTIEETQFRENIQKKIDKVSSKYGSVEVFELSNLQEYSKVCVFELGSEVAFSNNLTLSKYPLLLGEVEDKTANFFLIGDTDAAERFLNTNIVVGDAGFVCKDITDQGTIKLRLEGQGKVTKVSFIE